MVIKDPVYKRKIDKYLWLRWTVLVILGVYLAKFFLKTKQKRDKVFVSPRVAKFQALKT